DRRGLSRAPEQSHAVVAKDDAAPSQHGALPVHAPLWLGRRPAAGIGDEPSRSGIVQPAKARRAHRGASAGDAADARRTDHRAENPRRRRHRKLGAARRRLRCGSRNEGPCARGHHGHLSPRLLAQCRRDRMRAMLLGLIGASIQRSLAPVLQEEEARHNGIRMHYQLIDLEGTARGADALPALIEAARVMRFAGPNITYPCKQTVIPLLDVVSNEARAIGAVNTVVREGDRLVGYNTDGSGWSWGFQRALPKADLARVVLLGAGGAGSACADAVLRLGAERLVVVDKDVARSAELVKRLNSHFKGKRASAGAEAAAALEGATGLIQATPVGMAKLPGMPIPERLLRPAMWYSEVVYVPLVTPLLKAARRIGCATADGGHMNVGQAVGGFKLFTGLDADVGRMDAHFRQLVTQRSKEAA